jgi:3-oxoacyl-[acyl-carrier-protein] synthase-1
LEQGDTAGSQLGLFGRAIAKELDLVATPWIISNACASGVSALILAADLVHAKEADHVLVIGVDVLSRFVLSGFGALQALSAGPCRPFDQDRDGITLGEAAASLIVSGDRAAFDMPLGEYLGGGLANDANHISGPSRTGEGLSRAVQAALAQAAMQPDGIHALNAHGTGTAYNDAMEAQAFHRCGLQHVPVASYKGYFGHTLGAAGLLETVIAVHALREGLHLRSEGTRTPGLPLPLDVVLEHRAASGDTLLKTSSGFGGTNAATILRAWTA